MAIWVKIHRQWEAGQSVNLTVRRLGRSVVVIPARVVQEEAGIVYVEAVLDPEIFSLLDLIATYRDFYNCYHRFTELDPDTNVYTAIAGDMGELTIEACQA